MTSSDHVSISKTISHALRHEPWVYELELDEDGWVAVQVLLDALREVNPLWESLTDADLAEVIASSDKQRHEMRDGKIRALYGHSIAGKLIKAPAAPPDVLYHGTARRAVPLISRDGLRPMSRQYVHLSADRDIAQQVGLRKDRQPVIGVVRASEASQKGVRFFRGNDRVWLADAVPAEFITFST
jgi:putative RNA 2'-phosphotransferase